MHTILKLDDDLHLVIGVAMVAGEVDAQGDVIDEKELTKAAMRALGAKVKIDHEGEPVGRVVQSFVLGGDVQKALGITMPGNAAWIVGLKVDDPAIWRQIKSRELSGGLSIGGRAIREAVK